MEVKKKTVFDFFVFSRKYGFLLFLHYSLSKSYYKNAKTNRTVNIQ